MTNPAPAPLTRSARGFAIRGSSICGRVHCSNDDCGDDATDLHSRPTRLLHSLNRIARWHSLIYGLCGHARLGIPCGAGTYDWTPRFPPSHLRYLHATVIRRPVRPRQYRETRHSHPDKETNSDHPGKNIQADTEQAPHPLSARNRGPHLQGATNQTDKING